MIRKPEDVTIVILSEPEAKEVSVRYSLRCIGRDFKFLFFALAGHVKHFYKTTSRGWVYKNCLWTRS